MAVDLERLLLMHTSATRGEWKADNWGRVWVQIGPNAKRTVADCVRVTVKSLPAHRKNAKLIAAMHGALPELITELSAKDALLRHLALLIITRAEYFGKCYTVDDVLKLAKETMDVS